MDSVAVPWRVRQIRSTGSALNWFGRFPPALRLISFLRWFPLTRGIYRILIGYQRVFNSLDEAEAAIGAYSQKGHQHPGNVDTHIRLSISPVPSDYAALFHIDQILPRLNRVFDFGGNVGNLYYCYCRYLDFPKNLVWQVHDLPDNMARGRVLASDREAQPLSFVESWDAASGADLLLISGALHYMREPLATMLAQLDELPKYILINRTPVTEDDPFCAVQDGGQFRVACKVNNRQVLLNDLQQAGYLLVDSWQATELALRIPADPLHSIPFYSGFLLKRISAS